MSHPYLTSSDCCVSSGLENIFTLKEFGSIAGVIVWREGPTSLRTAVWRWMELGPITLEILAHER